jgi:hypothetical protein
LRSERKGGWKVAAWAGHEGYGCEGVAGSEGRMTFVSNALLPSLPSLLPALLPALPFLQRFPV